MLPLEAAQRAMVNTLANGPAHCPADLFAGPPQRVLLGLKAHANTISHARLKALEEVFGLLRSALGAAQFNHACRHYIETPAATAVPLGDIGAGLPPFLRSIGLPQTLIDLANVELAWLASARAADAPALTLADLAGDAPEALLARPVARHPALRLLTLAGPPAPALLEAAPALAGAGIILFTRPGWPVQLMPADIAMRAALIHLTPSGSVGRLIAAIAQAAPGSDPVATLVTLVDAGSLVDAAEEQLP